MDELKNCPFCGSIGKLDKIILKNRDVFLPACLNEKCIACSFEHHFNYMDEALKAWNTRADGWISVKERLPEEPRIMVLVANASGVSDALFLSGKFHIIGEVLDDITHWMPLPKAPKQPGHYSHS